jgi:hypothetical protein
MIDKKELIKSPLFNSLSEKSQKMILYTIDVQERRTPKQITAEGMRAEISGALSAIKELMIKNEGLSKDD